MGRAMSTGSYVRSAGSRWTGSGWAGSRRLVSATDKGWERVWPFLGLGFLLARAPLFGTLFPFGLPFYLAVARQQPRYRLPVAGAIAAGALSRDPALGLEVAVLLFFAHLLAPRVLSRHGLAGASAVALVLTATVRSVAAVAIGASPMNLALVLAESFLALLLTLVGSYALPDPRRSAPPLWGLEQILALSVLGAGAVAGTGGISLGSFRLEGMVAPALTMLAGYTGGPGLGATVGVVTGLVLASPGPEAAWGVAVPAFTGLTSGVFRDLGRAGTAVGGLLGSLLMTFYAYAAVPAGRVLVEYSLAVVLFVLLPAGWLRVAQVAFRGAGEAELGVIRQRQLYDRVVQRLQATSRILAELDRSLQPCAAPSRNDSLREFAGAVAFRLCDGCKGFRACWEEDFSRTYRAMLALLGAVEDGRAVSADDLPEAIRRRCPHAHQLVTTVSGLGELYHASRHWQQRVQEYCALLQEEVGALAVAMSRLADEAVAPPSPTGESHPLRYELATVRLPRSGESVAGDAVLVKELEAGKLLVVLSDGMGAGEKAEASSQAACALVARMVDVGFDLSLAVRLANLVLQRQGEAERFVTLDAALLNLEAGQMRILKLGAAPSYLKRGSEVTVFRSPSWPLGILPLVRADPQDQGLQPGDLLLLASDGLWERSEGSEEDWVFGWVGRVRAGSVSEIADRLVSKATDYGRRPLGDDLALVVLRILPRA